MPYVVIHHELAGSSISHTSDDVEVFEIDWNAIVADRDYAIGLGFELAASQLPDNVTRPIIDMILEIWVGDDDDAINFNSQEEDLP